MNLDKASAAALIAIVSTTPAWAQLTAAREGRIVYGHHHINASDVEAHKRFWVDGLGGASVKVGTSAAEIVKFPNVLVFLSARAPSGGTKGTTVNHVGFEVSNIRRAVDSVRAAGFPIVTGAEVPPGVEVVDDLAVSISDGKTRIAFVMGPDGAKVELSENTEMRDAIRLHHIHFAAPHVGDMKAWYAKVFGAQPGMRGTFEAADLPGVNLTYSPAPDPVVPTRGRALDHIGFEVKDLEAFCRQLEGAGITLDRPYTKVPALGIVIAFLTDPWGTYIELTEGLAAIP